MRIEAPCSVHTVGLANYYIPESEGSAEMFLSSKYVKSKKQGEPIEIKGLNFSGSMEVNETEKEPKGMYDATITGTFSKDRTVIEELTVTYTFRKPSGPEKYDKKWNFTARNLPYKQETKDYIEYSLGPDNKAGFSLTKAAFLFSISEERTTGNGVTYHYTSRIDSFKIALASTRMSLKFYKSATMPSLNLPRSANN